MSIEALSIVLNHSKAKGTAKLVLIGIANHLGPDADEGAWPSQNRLATYANVTDRAVRNAIDELVLLGELRFEKAGGNSRSQYKPNRYWIDLRCPSECDGSLGHNRVERIDRQTGNILHSDRNAVSSESSINLKLNKREREELKSFDEFWHFYPRKEDKAMARKKYLKALKAATPEEINQGAYRYASDPNLPDEITFIKKAHTWLEAQAWENGPLPPRRQPKQKPQETNWDELAQWAREQDEREGRS